MIAASQLNVGWSHKKKCQAFRAGKAPAGFVGAPAGRVVKIIRLGYDITQLDK